jgi:hypothetical protein
MVGTWSGSMSGSRAPRGHRIEVPGPGEGAGRGPREGARRGPRCTSIVPQALRIGLERGEIGWRDLIDFYARHPCQTYQFSMTYQAFTGNGAQRLPVTAQGG